MAFDYEDFFFCDEAEKNCDNFLCGRKRGKWKRMLFTMISPFLTMSSKVFFLFPGYQDFVLKC